MKITTDVIADSLLFNGLAEEYLKKIQEVTVLRSFNKGETVFSEGDDGDGFYQIVDGKIKVFKLSYEGKEKILHILVKGEPFGEAAVFSGKQFPANAECLVKSKLLFFPRKDFVRLISENPPLALNMLSVLSSRLKQFTLQIENLTLKDVPGRLAAYIANLDKTQKNLQSLELPITKGQLASLLGTIPETLSRILAKMIQQGLIEVQGKSIRILNSEGLEDLAESGRFLDDTL